MASWVSNMFGGPKAGRVVSVRSRGGRGGGRSAGQQKAYDADIRRENQARLGTMQTQLQGETDSANAANQERYEKLLASVAGTQADVTGGGGTFDQMEGLMADMGREGTARIQDNRTQQLASSEQDLMSRGLGNTTIRETAKRGINTDIERQQQALNENVALMKSGVKGQKAGAQIDLGRLMSNSILSRQDVGPNQDLYAQLVSQMFSA